MMVVVVRCCSFLFFWLLLLEGLVVCGQSELAFIGMHSWLSLSLLLVSQVNEGRVGVGVVGIVVDRKSTRLNSSHT